jgi:hypothetical protein
MHGRKLKLEEMKDEKNSFKRVTNRMIIFFGLLGLILIIVGLVYAFKGPEGFQMNECILFGAACLFFVSILGQS